MANTTRPPPPASSDASRLSTVSPCAENYPGPVPCGGSGPISPTLKSTPPEITPWRTPQTPLGLPHTGPWSSSAMPNYSEPFSSLPPPPTIRRTRRHGPYQVLKRGDRLYQFSIRLEGPLRNISQLLPWQPSVIPLHPLVSLGSVEVPPVQCMPGHQHIALGALWVGDVSLLQYDDGIPDMPVKEMSLHCRPSQTPLDRTVPRSPGGWEGHTVGTWIYSGGLSMY